MVDWWSHRTKFSIIRPNQSDLEVVQQGKVSQITRSPITPAK